MVYVRLGFGFFLRRLKVISIVGFSLKWLKFMEKYFKKVNEVRRVIFCLILCIKIRLFFIFFSCSFWFFKFLILSFKCDLIELYYIFFGLFINRSRK